MSIIKIPIDTGHFYLPSSDAPRPQDLILFIIFLEFVFQLHGEMFRYRNLNHLVHILKKHLLKVKEKLRANRGEI